MQRLLKSPVHARTLATTALRRGNVGYGSAQQEVTPNPKNPNADSKQIPGGSAKLPRDNQDAQKAQAAEAKKGKDEKPERLAESHSGGQANEQQRADENASGVQKQG